MRRLYSTFAGGGPGIALLLMRLVVGTVVLWQACPTLWIGPPLHIVVSGPLALAALYRRCAQTSPDHRNSPAPGHLNCLTGSAD